MRHTRPICAHQERCTANSLGVTNIGSKTNTTTQSTTPPAALLAQYQDLISRASSQSQNGAAPYGADTALQQQGYGGISSIPGQYLPQAESYAEQGGAPITAGQIGNYTNPFQQDVTNATEANINETNAEQQNQLTGNAIAQGALGGNRVGVAQGELARQQGLANNATYAGLNATNYDQALQAAQADRAAAAGTAGTYAGLEGTALQGAAAQLGAGTQQQSYANQGLQWPYQNLDWLSQIEGQTGPLEGNTSKTTQPAPNILSQILGGGLALAGLPGSSLGGSFLSSLFGSGGAAPASPFSGSDFGGLYARGGGIGVRHRAPGGGISLPFGMAMPQAANGAPSLLGRFGMPGGIGTPQRPQPQPGGRAGGMVANALNLARTMKAGMGGMGGIGVQHFDSGGGVGTMVPAIPGFADWDTPPSDPTSVAATAALGDLGAQGWIGAPSVAQAAGIGTPAPPVYTPGAPNPVPPDFNPYTPAFPGIAGAPAAAVPSPRPAPTAPATGIAAPAVGAPMALAGSDPLTQYGNAIGTVETGGQKNAYGYVEPSSGALGKYQVMPENVGPWTKQVLGTAMTPQQFLANPQAQEAVFKGIFGQYLQQTGDPNKAAAMWFGGPGVNASTGPDALGTTVAGYVQKFNDALNGGASPGGIGTPQTATVAAAGPGAAGIATPAGAGTPPGIGHGQLLKAFLSRPGNQALTDVGLGIMGGTSPFFGTNVGQGAMQGLDMDRQLQQLQAQINYQQELVGIRGEQADTAAAKPVVIGHDPQTFQPIYGVPNPGQPGTFIQTDLQGNQTGAVIDASGNPVASSGTGSSGATPTVTSVLPPTDPGYTTVPVAGGATSAAIDQAALSFITNGTMPTSGSRGAAGQVFQTAVRNRAAVIDPSGNLAANKAQLGALNKSLTTQTGYLNNVQRSFNTANTTLQSVLGWMNQNNINPSQFPDFNSMANYASSHGLDVGPIKGFQSQIAQLRTEYAQVLARNGQMTDSVRSAANDVIPDNISPKDLATVASRLNVDSNNALDAVNQQINQIWGQINGIATGGTPAAPSASGTTPAATPAASASATPPTDHPDAKQAPDGKWYVPDPAKPGSFLMVQP